MFLDDTPSARAGKSDKRSQRTAAAQGTEALTAGVALLSYGLHCQEAPTLVEGRQFASLPFVIFGLLEYLRVAYVRNEGASPIDVVLRSPALLISGCGWVASVLVLWSLGIF